MRLRLLVLPAFALLLVACPKSSDSSGGAPAATTPPPTSPPPSAAPAAPGAAAPSFARAADVVKTSQGDLRIVPIHHGSVLFELGGKEYYVDPFHEGGKLEGLPPADVIFITHAHPDHLDPAAIGSLRKPWTIIVCPPSVAEKLPVDPRAGRKDSSGIVVLKNGDKQSVAGVGVEAIAMYNLQRGPAPGKLFHEKGWGEGFVLTFGDTRVYLSGDTECTPEMRALKDIDVAFVCMNLPYTMPPAEAAECIEAFKPKILYPYHYRGSDLAELDKALAADKQIEVRKRDWY
jgi:L-ascorbate metabolism protein UlaG (beta-lactamase superfamily)